MFACQVEHSSMTKGDTLDLIFVPSRESLGENVSVTTKNNVNNCECNVDNPWCVMRSLTRKE